MKSPEFVCHSLRQIAHGAVATAGGTVIEVYTDTARPSTFTNLNATTVHSWATVSFLEAEVKVKRWHVINTGMMFIKPVTTKQAVRLHARCVYTYSTHTRI